MTRVESQMLSGAGIFHRLMIMFVSSCDIPTSNFQPPWSWAVVPKELWREEWTDGRLEILDER